MARDNGRRTGAPEGTCRRCAADMLWAWLLGQRGRRVPLNPERRPADDRSARYAVSRDHLGRLRARQLDDDEAPAPWEWRGASHLDTCRVLADDRAARASLRAAKASAPNPYDPEELAEARQERRA